ncbi:hypothetical protein GGR52DRAFT_580583 [Hypoxylon sp. FL1284]|nr:hypothetical protein GGR52DRAFT_580583 [Hypoxylon sp. FL1284]
MGLLRLPGELLLQVMEELRDSRDVQALQNAAGTCKALRQVADVYLYSVVHFSRLSSQDQFLDALRAKPARWGHVRSLSLLFSTQRYDFYNSSTPVDLTSFPNLTTFVSESPECQPLSARGTNWPMYMDAYNQAFLKASFLGEQLEAQRPLQSLTSLTLHWTGADMRIWAVTPASPIFLLPQLQFLEISCVRVDKDESSERAVDPFRRKTRLESLILTECVVSVEALRLVLSLPSALQRLELGEKYFHQREPGGRFAVNDTPAFNYAIAQQSRSLKHLHIRCHRHFTNRPGVLALSLSDFPALSHLQLSPFLRNRTDYTHVSSFVIDHPMPPALCSLRLTEYDGFMLEAPAVDKILSDLSVKDLVRNAESRGFSFTLDISLLRHLRRHRTSLLGPVEQLRQTFEKFQATSARSDAKSNSELSRDRPNEASSRLRILTSKERNKIPPFLHDEGPPRFVARYDSWHPEKFLRHPYTADPIPPDRDLSSDDDIMDAAFNNNAATSPDSVIQVSG